MSKAKTAKKAPVFTAEEKAAMREYVREQKAREAGANEEKEVLAKIKQMRGPDREMGERVHAIVKAAAPHLMARTWYGMPAYSKGKDIICFFQPAAKFKTRYSTLGFNNAANLDDGDMWPVAYALTKVTAAEEKKIQKLVKQAAS